MTEHGADRARIEREVRTRVAEAMSSAGLPQSQVALQVLFQLPPDFVDAYSAIFFRAFKTGDEGRRSSEGRIGADGKPVEGVRTSGSRESRMSEGRTLGGMSGAKTTGRRHRRVWVVADERALSRKTRADKTLRKVARELMRGMEQMEMEDQGGSGSSSGDEEVTPRCTNRRCSKFLSLDWRYCPWCGTRRRRIDEENNER